jgi:O-methyltransferase
VKFWAALSSYPQSRFFGFDSFEGPPEEWNRDDPAGFYSANGKIPQIDDARIQFVVGWFQNSLPLFLETYKPKNPMVIHSGTGLYSSTLYSFTAMNALMVQGTVIIFDEFYDPVNENRALQDYGSASMRK